MFVLSGHLHQDSERLKPAEQRSGVCEVREGCRLSIFLTGGVFLQDGEQREM